MRKVAIVSHINDFSVSESIVRCIDKKEARFVTPVSPLNPEPYIITALPHSNTIDLNSHKKKPDCSKGHTYQRYITEKSENYYIQDHICDCGKKLFERQIPNPKL